RIVGIFLRDQLSGRFHSLPEFPGRKLPKDFPARFVMHYKAGDVKTDDVVRTDSTGHINGILPAGSFVSGKRTSNSHVVDHGAREGFASGGVQPERRTD